MHHVPGGNGHGFRQLSSITEPRSDSWLPERHVPLRVVQAVHPHDPARGRHHVLRARGVQTAAGRRPCVRGHH